MSQIITCPLMAPPTTICFRTQVRRGRGECARVMVQLVKCSCDIVFAAGRRMGGRVAGGGAAAP